MTRLSIKDIAKMAGVVPSTVSFVINGKDKEMRISPQLSARIKKILTETGYTPNRLAVSLRTGKTNVLGLIIEDISNSFFASLAKNIESFAEKINYRVVYCSTENDDKKGNELIKLLSNEVDGFVIAPTKGMAKGLKYLTKIKKPFIQIDRYLPEVDAPYVMIDNYSGIKTGVEHLISKGYKHIALVTVDLDQVQMKEREQGYIDSLRDNKLFHTRSVLKIPYKTKDFCSAIKNFLKENRQTDAIVFATNYLGIVGLQAIRQLNKKIPDDIAVVCFDDHDLFQFYTPTITVVGQPLEEIAQNAITLLSNQISKKKVITPSKMSIPGKLILRESI